VKHTINARKCPNCGKGMRPPIKGRESLSNLCHSCVNNREELPEKYLCKGISKSTNKRCKKITMGSYCPQHKKQGENNAKEYNSKKENNKNA
jgi:hypothetical protein